LRPGCGDLFCSVDRRATNSIAGGAKISNYGPSLDAKRNIPGGRDRTGLIQRSPSYVNVNTISTQAKTGMYRRLLML
jgi:hypothetical protein